MESYIYHSSDFQCPVSGVPIWLIYNEDTGMITAEICEFVCPLVPEENEFYDEKIIKETKDWCNYFYEYAEDFDKANEIAEKYDCWF